MIGRIVMGRAAVLGVLAGLIALLMLASPASATLHGWCGSGATSTCIDNGTNTPTSNNPPNPFAFTGSMAETGVQYRIDVLVPNNEASASSFIITGGTISPATATLVSTTPWTSGFLDAYLGISASPSNPIGNYLGPCAAATPCTKNLDPGATGFFVFQADLGAASLNGASGPGVPQLSINTAPPLASFIVAFLNEGTVGSPSWQATANSGALFLTSGSQLPRPTAEPASLVLLGTGLLGIAGYSWRKRRTAK